METRRWVTVLAAIAVCAAARPARAIELADGKLNISAFGRWVYGDSDGNAYLVARDRAKGDTLILNLNVHARPYEQLVLAAQAYWEPSRAAVDWAFAEWRFSDRARLRAGQVKLPFGAYWEVKDVGTLRPFTGMPMSIYSYADVAAESYYGLGLTGSLAPTERLELSYDAYFGQMWVESSDRFRRAPASTPPPSPAPPTATPYASSSTVFTRLDNTLGGRLTATWVPLGLTLRLSAYRGEVADLGLQTQVADPGTAFYAYGVSLSWLSEHLEVRSEAFRKHEGEGDTAQDAETAYVEVAYRFLEHFQVAGRAEVAHYDLADPALASIPASLRRHEELAVGINYWFNRDFVMKLSHHWVNGNRFAVPEYPWTAGTTDGNNTPPNPADVTYDAKTRAVIFSAQFAF
jgi:hypothetical protein